ncbi:E3 ubiquitin-protein ligase RNF125-like [Drosophila subpulchrella]|uniref:E3 ubiquitin-protein ligase RNF125-like n=1 Tax=Drosophila subpulchrella TaxID=1486046 RepID=UPI0018A1804C|nr:E3 ubiquitin-protein ligase RNF125-like [Drosophila subpulchrella]
MFSYLRSLLGFLPIKKESTRRAADGIEPEAIIDLTEEVVPITRQLVDENMDPYECPVCFDSPNEPVATRCGHVFCKECLISALEPSKLCPKCRETVTSFVRLYTYLP